MFGYNYAVLIAELEQAIEAGNLDLSDTILIERDKVAILNYHPIKTWHPSEHQYSLQDIDIAQLDDILEMIDTIEENFDDMEESNVSTVLKEMKEKSARLNSVYSLKH